MKLTSMGRALLRSIWHTPHFSVPENDYVTVFVEFFFSYLPVTLFVSVIDSADTNKVFPQLGNQLNVRSNWAYTKNKVYVLTACRSMTGLSEILRILRTGPGFGDS